MNQELALNTLSPEMRALFAQVMEESGEDKETISGGGNPIATLSLRDKKFRIRDNGEEVDLGNEQRVVIVKHYPHEARKNAKSYYDVEYSEARRTGPACLSYDGINPIGGMRLMEDTGELIQLNTQAPSCEGCAFNVWGTGKGGNGRACRDEYRLAVVRYEDAEAGNWRPLLLLVGPSSLKGYKTFRAYLKEQGAPLAGVSVVLKFDQGVRHEKLVFDATSVRPLPPHLLVSSVAAGKESEAHRVIGMAHTGEVSTAAPPPVTIDATPVPTPAPAPQPAPPPPPPAPEPAPQPAAAPPAPPVPTPEPVPATPEDDDTAKVIAALAELKAMAPEGA